MHNIWQRLEIRDLKLGGIVASRKDVPRSRANVIRMWAKSRFFTLDGIVEVINSPFRAKRTRTGSCYWEMCT